MFHQEFQKNAHMQVTNNSPELFSLCDNTNEQLLRKLELPKVLGSPKLNKNLVKLTPLSFKKKPDNEFLQLPLGMGFKEEVHSIDQDSCADIRSVTTLDSLQTVSSMNTRGQPKPEIDFPSIQDLTSADIKGPLHHKKSTPILCKVEIRKKKNITCRPSQILKATSWSEARLMMVGLTPMKTFETEPFEKRIDKSDEILNFCSQGPLNLPDLKKNSSAPAELEPFKRLFFSPILNEKLLRRHIKTVLKGINYSLNMLKPLPLSYVKNKQVLIREPQSVDQKTLLLDLDETLVYACALDRNPDKILTLENDGPTLIGLKIRPFTAEFLKKMREHFEIIVYTASAAPYAEAVVKQLDPGNKYISYILDRSRCFQTKNGFFIKDLRIIKNRELKNMVIVDNLVHSFGFQINNGIPILEWKGDSKDQELKYLMDYLIDAVKVDDIREYNKEKLKLADLLNFPITSDA